MHRFYLPSEASQLEVVELRASDARHAVNVLRLKQGARIQILNGEGGVLEGQIAELSKRTVTVQVLSRTHHDRPEPLLGVALAQLKPKAMEWALQKATELGVTDIWLIESERSVSKWHSQDDASKLDKANGTIVEAMKQCGTLWKPNLHAPLRLDPWVSSLSSDWRVAFGNLDPRVDSEPIWKTAQAATDQSICWCIGPEGDFTESEAQTLLKHSATPVDLGTLVLRSETAVLCGLSVFAQWHHFRRQMDA